MNQHVEQKQIVGWREWVSLPALGIPAVKAKVDTGARTSALHAYELESFTENGVEKVRFSFHPLQKRTDVELHCVADVFDRRTVTDSGGHREQRFVIRTPVVVGGRSWEVEMTLTNRETMLFRMLLGRTTLRSRFVVDPSLSYALGKTLEGSYDHPLTADSTLPLTPENSQ